MWTQTKKQSLGNKESKEESIQKQRVSHICV